MKFLYVYTCSCSAEDDCRAKGPYPAQGLFFSGSRQSDPRHYRTRPPRQSDRRSLRSPQTGKHQAQSIAALTSPVPTRPRRWRCKLGQSSAPRSADAGRGSPSLCRHAGNHLPSRYPSPPASGASIRQLPPRPSPSLFCVDARWVSGCARLAGSSSSPAVEPDWGFFG